MNARAFDPDFLTTPVLAQTGIRRANCRQKIKKQNSLKDSQPRARFPFQGDDFMNEPTRPSLLVRLRDGADQAAWAEFVDLYTPLVHGFLRRRGLQEADAADIAQEVFRTAARAIPQFRHQGQAGAFRAWLLTVTRSRLQDFLAARRRQVSGTGDTAMLQRLEQQPDPAGEEDAWEKEYQREVFQWAAAQVRGEFQDATWQAFWQSYVEGKEPREVAEILGRTEGAVYIARCRVLARLKQRIAEAQS